MPLSFAAPQFLWALLALPLVALLHFVRSRRRRTEVSALFLWQRARRTAERRRRIAPTWLLLAQLLFTALAALALARPQLAGAAAPDRVIVVDASASMAAHDSDGARVDKARAVAARLLSGAGRVALLRAGVDVRVLVPLTAERAAVRRALAGLQVGDETADLERAVSVAEAVDPGARIDVVTDSPPPPGGTRVRYHGVAGDGVNVGISAFDLGIQQAYVGVVSNSRRPLQVGVRLTRDGAPVASGSVLVPAGGVGSITFPLTQIRGTYRAAIDPPAGSAAGDPAGDALTLDDVAYAGARQIGAAVQQPDDAVLKALDAVPGVSVRVDPRAADVAADLRVLTVPPGAPDPASLPPGAYLLFAPRAAKPDYHVIRDFDRGSPLMRFVDLQDVVVGLDPQRTAWQAGGGGWQVLASTADLEPVLRYRDAGGVRVLQAAFNPSQTDLVLRAAFPALMANLVRQLRGDDRLPMGSALPPGTVRDAAASAGTAPAQGQPAGAAGAGVAGGGTAAGSAPAGPGATGSGATGTGATGSGATGTGATDVGATDAGFALEPGVFRLPGGRLALVSLGSESESRLPGPAALAGGGGQRAGGATSAPAAPPSHVAVTSLAVALLALALAALVAEWLLYSGGSGGGAGGGGVRGGSGPGGALRGIGRLRRRE